MKEKLAVTVLVTTLALFGLVVVLYRMIKDKNEDYTQIVLNQHSSYDSRTIPYRRGDIVDRNGTYLATSEKVYNLILDPNQINQDKENYLEPTVAALCEVFGYDRADILATISANENSYYVPYEKQISADKKEEFETKKKELNDAYAKSKEDSGKKIKGVWFEDEYRRFYPYNTLACNVVGFSYDTESREVAELSSITMTSSPEQTEESMDTWMTSPTWRRSLNPLRTEIPSSPPSM